MDSKKKILFVIGSPNQTTQMFQIYQHLKDDYDCFFTQFFGDHPLTRIIVKLGWLDSTIHGGQFKEKADQFCRENGLRQDYMGTQLGNTYDLVFICNDMTVPKLARRTKSIYVQEGMTDPVNWATPIVHALGLPGVWTFNTSLNGCSNLYDVGCVASVGYKDYLSKWGTEKKKLFITGIPNFDNAEAFRNNQFPYHDYILVCSTDMRETGRFENRPKFIRECVEYAAGKKIIWKLHPNEKYDRAIKEIREISEDILVFQDGNTNEMIANCSELITQYSSVVYMGMALGKKVRSLFPIEVLKRNMPLQNGGKSAENIARIAREYIEFKGTKEAFYAYMHSNCHEAEVL
jgi:hypothetical protein